MGNKRKEETIYKKKDYFLSSSNTSSLQAFIVGYTDVLNNSVREVLRFATMAVILVTHSPEGSWYESKSATIFNGGRSGDCGRFFFNKI